MNHDHALITAIIVWTVAAALHLYAAWRAHRRHRDEKPIRNPYADGGA